MAIVMEMVLPSGGRVRVHDDCLAKDNAAARKEAYDVAARIHWQLVREGKIKPKYADDQAQAVECTRRKKEIRDEVAERHAQDAGAEHL